MSFQRGVVSARPGTHVTAGVIVRDGEGRVLLVEPTYRTDWLTPGGSVEAGESPRQAAAREAREELGLTLSIGRVLAMQWEPQGGNSDGILHFAYDGGVIGPEHTATIHLETGLASYRFLEPTALLQLASATTVSRIEASLEALARRSFVEL